MVYVQINMMLQLYDLLGLRIVFEEGRKKWGNIMAMYILMEDGAVVQLELSTLSGHEPDKTLFKGT